MWTRDIRSNSTVDGNVQVSIPKGTVDQIFITCVLIIIIMLKLFLTIINTFMVYSRIKRLILYIQYMCIIYDWYWKMIDF